MSKIYCLLEGQNIFKCHVEHGQSLLKACLECTYYQKTIKWFQELKKRRQREEQEQQKSEDALAKGIIRLNLDLPEPKKSNSKMRKQDYVTDSYTGKRRRLRFDIDYWKRNRFQSSLCLICQRLCKKHGWKFKEKKEGSPGGKQIALNMTIQQIMKQPEMKWMKRFKRLGPRTLAGWRRKYCGYFSKKEDPRLQIYVGRPRKLKLARPPKTR